MYQINNISIAPVTGSLLGNFLYLMNLLSVFEATNLTLSLKYLLHFAKSLCSLWIGDLIVSEQSQLLFNIETCFTGLIVVVWDYLELKRRLTLDYYIISN